MANDKRNNDLLPATPPGSLKDQILALIEAHFPHLDGAGVEAHQPIREFLLAVTALLP